jgi:hypothetical protein
MAVTVVTTVFVAVANFSYRNLLMRSYPVGLEGTGSSIISTVVAIAGVTSDLAGARLYKLGGFGVALTITTITTALVLPALFFVPGRLMAGKETESIASDPALDALDNPA